MHHRATEDTEKNHRDNSLPLFFLCVLCVSSERNERVVKISSGLAKKGFRVPQTANRVPGTKVFASRVPQTANRVPGSKVSE